MKTAKPPSASSYKDLILNVRQPTVLHRTPLTWPCLNRQQMPIERWLAHFDEDERYDATAGGIAFHLGARSGTGAAMPQWEKMHRVKRMRMADFLHIYADDDKTTTDDDVAAGDWASFSYRTIGDLPAECRRGIGLEALGLDRNAAEEFSFWLGSRGAHTPCHYDTYGCNVVVQVYGSKLWLLMPPGAHLTPTRVPYEESSVYCTQNFFSPDAETTRQMTAHETKAYRIVLQPGDVLIVPPKWWHYAENQTLSLSINSWIPLDTDLDAQMEECIVRSNVTEYTRHLPVTLQRALVNPNELNNDMYEQSLPKQLAILEYIAKHLRSAEARRSWPMKTFPHNYLSEAQVQTLIDVAFGGVNADESSGAALVSQVPELSVAEFHELLQRNGQRLYQNDELDGAQQHGTDDDEEADAIRMCSSFINATCCPSNVHRIKENILGGVTE